MFSRFLVSKKINNKPIRGSGPMGGLIISSFATSINDWSTDRQTIVNLIKVGPVQWAVVFFFCAMAGEQVRERREKRGNPATRTGFFWMPRLLLNLEGNAKQKQRDIGSHQSLGGVWPLWFDLPTRIVGALPAPVERILRYLGT